MINKYISLLIGGLILIQVDCYAQIYTSEVEVKADANGNVGIGTAAPVEKLSIDGGKLALYWNDNISSFNTVDAHPRISSTGQTGSYPFDIRGNLVLQPRPIDATDIVFATGAIPSPKLIVKGTGNIGIGTSAPESLLDVYPSLGNTELRIGSAPSNLNSTIRLLEARSNYDALGAYLRYDGNSNIFHIGVNDNGSTDQNAISIIRGDGNVGIGTTSPQAKLQVNGNLNIGSSLSTNIESPGITLGTDQKTIELIHSNYGSGYGSKIYGVDEGNGITSLRIATRGGSTTWKDAMYFTASSSGSNGRVGIGTNSPSSELEIAGWYGRSAHNNGGLVGSYNNVGTNSTKTNPIYTIGHSYKPLDAALNNMYGVGYTHTNASFITDPGPNSWGMYVASDGDARIWLAASSGGHSYFNSGGNVGISRTSPSYKLDVNGSLRATSITESSDRRLKKNISNLDSETDRLKDIESHSYSLKEDDSYHFGLVAQEVEKIFPHMVSTDDEGYKSVAYREFIPLLIEKTKNQDERINNLEKQNQELADRLASIEEKLNLNAKK